MSEELKFKSNSFATLSFTNREVLSEFAVVQSERVASLLHLLVETNGTVDDGFISAALEIARDLSFEVQLAVNVLNGKEAEVAA